MNSYVLDSGSWNPEKKGLLGSLKIVEFNRTVVLRVTVANKKIGIQWEVLSRPENGFPVR